MNMKTIPLAILTLALSLAAVSAQDAQRPPQITVSGTADVLVAPDEAIIHVGVETRNENLEQARHAHDDRMKSALKFLKSSGVPDKDVQTDFINLTTEYNGDSSKNRPMVYVARTYIEVKLTNVTNLEKILSGLLTAGVDRINHVEFRTTQLRKYRDQARALAIRAAKEKADALCLELDVKRGKPLNINASESGGWSNPYGSYWGARNYGMASNAQVSVQDTEGPSDSTNDTMSLGQISVSATVNVSFALQD
jgi:uncharacterized protein YggE